MILMELRDYLKEKRSASLVDIARHFDVPESAAQDMLEHWVRKGQMVCEIPVVSSCSSGCGGCANRCDSASVVYRWREMH